MSRRETRGALRLLLDVPVEIESIGQVALALHPALDRVYRRVHAAEDGRGSRATGALRDLSTNGAFVAGEPLPLLSRVALRFVLDPLEVEAIGWILWRRGEDCAVPRDDGSPLLLQRGFGVLFESIPFEARLLITKRVTQASRPAR